jgi:WD40 repeat protein
VGSGHPVRRFPGPLTALVLSPDGQRSASVSTARGLEIIDSVTGRILIRREGFSEHVAAPAFSQDGRWFALSDGNYRILIVRIGPAGEPQLFSQDVSEKVAGAARSAFTPDNRRLLISSNQNRYADVLDIGTRQVVAHLSGHTDVLSDIACTPDGLRYATGSLDGTVRLWDAATSRLLLEFQARMGQISLIAFSADGRSLMAMGTDGGVKVWDAASDAQTSAWETEGGSEGP